MCAPYPLYPYETDAGDDPLCVAAMQAFARGALCEDGGVVITGDAGTDTGAAPVDGGVDSEAVPVDAGIDTRHRAGGRRDRHRHRAGGRSRRMTSS